MKSLKVFCFVTLVLLFTLGCKSSDSSSSGSSAGSVELLLLANGTTSANRLDQAVGQASATQLTSLKYFIRDIKICESLTVDGSGYSGQSGCLSLYSSSATVDYDTYLADEALADTANYIDLMTAEGRSRLNSTVTLDASHARSYQWGIIDWYRPIKATAQVTLNDGNILYTKAGTTVTESGSGLNSTYLTEVTGMATAPAEESIVVLSNGGSWFRFQSPFVISTDDINLGTSFELKLVFNPEGIIKGYTSSTRTGLGIKDSGTQTVIHVPMLNLTPVAHAAGDQVMKESYLLKYTGAEITPTNIRLELFYLESDSSKTIYGVEATYLYTTSSTDELGDFYKTSYITTATGGTIEFEDWSQTAFLTNFTRLSAAGDTGTATLKCSSSSGFGSCNSGTLNVTTELLSIGAVN